MYYYSAYEIKLDSGRIIKLRRLKQWMTYERQLEGLPFFNKHHVERDRKSVEEKFYCPVTVIDASEQPMGISAEEQDYLTKHPPYVRRSFTSLHRIACAAYFTSEPMERGEEFNYASELSMLWYQEELCMPIAQVALAKIRSIDWDGLALNFSP